MGHRACGYRLRSGSCSGLAGGRGTLPNSSLRLRVDELCYLLRTAVVRRRVYPCPAAGDSGVVAGPTEPRALYGDSDPFLSPEQFVQFAAPPHLERVRGNH
jgi:hypothetical protein